MNRAQFRQCKRLHASIALSREVTARSLEAVERIAPIASHASRFTSQHRQACVVADCSAWQEVYPLVDQAQTALGDKFLAVSRRESCCLRVQPGFQIVVDCLRPFAVGLEVRRSMDMKANNLAIGPLGLKPPKQEAAEQAVVSVPGGPGLIESICE